LRQVGEDEDDKRMRPGKVNAHELVPAFPPRSEVYGLISRRDVIANAGSWRSESGVLQLGA